jgi:glycerate-2-kinase
MSEPGLSKAYTRQKIFYQMMSSSHDLIKNFDDLVGSRLGEMADLRSDVLRAAEQGIKNVMPECFMKRIRVEDNSLIIKDSLRIDLREFDEVVVLGVGKASVRMAEMLEPILYDRISGGVIASLSSPCECINLRKINVVPSSHPIPSKRSVEASEILLEWAESFTERTLAIFLLSGGASAMLALPAPPVTLEDKIFTTKLLLESGATIDEINTVRKHLSLVKGGWLGKRMSRARVISLILSDVVGNKVESIGSGPTAPDPTTFRDAYNILRRYDLWDRVPESIRRRIMDGLEGRVEETPKPGDPAFQRITNIVIADVGDACRAAASYLKSRGFRCIVLSKYVEGEASQVGIFLAGLLQQFEEEGGRRAAILGGEYTVTVRGGGIGGRNQELVLGSLLKLKDLRRSVIMSIGTDGVDGVSSAAGAIADPQTYHDAIRLGINPIRFLKENDSNSFFNLVGGAIYTGPTGTNVGDLTIIASA